MNLIQKLYITVKEKCKYKKIKRVKNWLLRRFTTSYKNQKNFLVLTDINKNK